MKWYSYASLVAIAMFVLVSLTILFVYELPSKQNTKLEKLVMVVLTIIVYAYLFYIVVNILNGNFPEKTIRW